MLTEQDEQLLQTYLDGEATAEQERVVELRLANSREWGEAEIRIRETMAACSELFAPFADDDTVLLRSMPNASLAAAQMGQKRAHRMMPIWAGALAAAAAIVGIAFMLRDGAVLRHASAPARVASAERGKVPGAVPGASVLRDSVSGVSASPRAPIDRRAAHTLSESGIELVGYVPSRVVTDSTLGVPVTRVDYALAGGSKLTLELSDAIGVETRSIPGAPLPVADTTNGATFVRGDVTNSLTWRLPDGRVARLSASLPETELRQLQRRVRSVTLPAHR
jgi:anti-sigma factor RsiW